MGHIFYVMGKSASGKDTIYKILRERLPQIRTVVPYTTRPIRAGERDGVEYYFVTGKRLADLEKQGKIIEKRTYQTIYGPWSYATVDDGQIDLGSHDYFMIGTLESYEGTRNYFGADVLVPLEEAEGRAARTCVTIYPPGVPMLMPGERIGTREIARIREDWKLGLTVEGICEKSDKLDLWIEVVI